MKKIFTLAILLSFFCTEGIGAQDYSWRKSIFFWTDSECDDCEECGSFLNSRKGSRLVKSKKIWGFCDGKDIGVWELRFVERCIRNSNFEVFFVIDGVDKKFNYEVDADTYAEWMIDQMCQNGEIQDGYETKEARRNRLNEEELKVENEHQEIWAKYKLGELEPIVSEGRYAIPKNELSTDYIVSNDWILAPDKLTKVYLSFDTTNSSFTMEIKELWEPVRYRDGKFKATGDGNIELTYSPEISRAYGRNFFEIDVDKMSWTERVGSYYVGTTREYNKGFSGEPIFKKPLGISDKDVGGTWKLKIKSSRRDLFYTFLIDLMYDKSSSKIVGSVRDGFFNEKSICPSTINRAKVTNDSLLIEIQFDNEGCNGERYSLNSRFITSDLLFGATKYIYRDSSKESSFRRATDMAYRDYSLKRVNKGRSDRNLRGENKADSKKLAQPQGKAVSIINTGDELDTSTSNTKEACRFDLWSLINTEQNVKGRKFRVKPLDKSQRLKASSPFFIVPKSLRTASLSIDKSKIKSGIVKVYLLTQTGIDEVVEKLVFEDIRNFDLESDLRISGLIGSSKVEKINVSLSRYSGKKVSIMVAYESTGAGKPFLDLVSLDFR